MWQKIWCRCNALTFLGIILSVLGIWFCYSNMISYAVITLVLAGICDAFDGTFAKKIGQEESAYGVQLDSLSDVVSSGVLPIVICLSMGFNHVICIPVYMFFLICGITRLAYYNVESSDKNYFSGVPITCSTMLIPLLYVITKIESIYIIALFILSVLFVTDLKIKKPSIKVRAILSLFGIVLSVIVIMLKFLK